MLGIVVSLFDKTGNMVRPWAEAGYDCVCYDIAHVAPRVERVGRGQIMFVPLDLMHQKPIVAEKVAFGFAQPPCTHTAVSGARWFKGKGLRLLGDSIYMFATGAEFLEETGAPYGIENPVSTIATYWRKPDFIMHPWWFTRLEQADNYTKTTCLWVGGASLCRLWIGFRPWVCRITAFIPRPLRTSAAISEAQHPWGFAEPYSNLTRR